MQQLGAEIRSQAVVLHQKWFHLTDIRLVKVASVVCLPISTTIIASLASFPTRKAAPLILLVGPLENVLIGNLAAASPDSTVPSFCVMKIGQ